MKKIIYLSFSLFYLCTLNGLERESTLQTTIDTYKEEEDHNNQKIKDLSVQIIQLQKDLTEANKVFNECDIQRKLLEGQLEHMKTKL